MNIHRRNGSRLGRLLCLSAAALALGVAGLRADTIYVKSGSDVNGFATRGVTVTKIAKDGETDTIYYTTPAGGTRTKPLDQVVKIELEDDPIFTQAENEFAAGKLEAAGADYRKAMAATTRDWVKRRADLRLLGISSQTGDFVGAVTGYVELARRDPASADAHKPAISGAKPDQLQKAIAAVNRGLGGAKSDTQQVLLPYLAELYTAAGDTAKAQAALSDLARLHPSGSSAAMPGDSAAGRDALQAQAELSLSTADKALAAQQYDQVIAAITKSKTAFIDPEKQARALYLLAQAKEATANTPETLSEAALAYMRVVANFKSQPTAPVADSLYHTGAIEEKLQKPREAALIYKQIISEFKDSKAAQDAQAALTRLNAAKE